MNKFQSEVIKVRTPNGTLFAFILENEDGSINQIQLTIGKAGNDIAPWAMAVADLINLSLSKGTKLEEIINLLSNLTSGREARSLGSVCRSGPEGIWQALMRYKRNKFADMNKNLDAADNLRGATVASWARTSDR